MELGAGATLRINITVQVSHSTTKISCLQAAHFPSSGVSFLNPTTHLRRHQSFRIWAKNSSISEAELKMVPLVHDDNLDLSSLTTLDPLDGRYSEKVKDLCCFSSEYCLIRYRVLVEITEVPNFSDDAKLFLENLVLNFSPDDALEVKKIEKNTNDDVKAVEYFLKDKCKPHTEVGKVLEFFHFACTSEDINNLAHGLMLRNAVNLVMLPIMDELINVMCDIASKTSNISMLSRTHGQVASPTTLGKEFAVFSFRLNKQKKLISQVKMLGKFAGAVGNYNTHLVTYPNIDWPKTAEEFVESFGLSFNPYVTQIESHDYIAELFHAVVRFNNILVDFNRDIRGYISLGYFKQTTKAGEVRSSTMPHKVNPIDFENSERNLGSANANLNHLSMNLPISQWQGDSTDLSSIGEGLRYSLLAYKSALQGVQKLQVNETQILKDLEQTYEVLAEPIQTVMRYNIPQPYEKLKEMTRGRAVTQEIMQDFVQRLDLPEEAKPRLGRGWPHKCPISTCLAGPRPVAGQHQYPLVLIVMRRYNIPQPYEKLKEMTRGRAVTQEIMQDFVQRLDLPEEAKSMLLNLSPLSYIGAAEELAKSVRTVIDSEQ